MPRQGQEGVTPSRLTASRSGAAPDQGDATARSGAYGTTTSQGSSA